MPELLTPGTQSRSIDFETMHVFHVFHSIFDVMFSSFNKKVFFDVVGDIVPAASGPSCADRARMYCFKIFCMR